MHKITELPPWEGLFKKIVWAQLGDPVGMRILDFGSGEGITANHFAQKNDVTAIEPSAEILANAWTDYAYTQIVGDGNALRAFRDGTFDMVLCHNVLEYVDDKAAVARALARVLKRGGILSVAKHNRAGRVMQMAVLLDDFDKANALLDGGNSEASQFGAIRYYEDADILRWAPELTVSQILGIRAFWDLQQNQEKHGDEDWQAKMVQLEMRAAQLPEYRNIAFFHHLLLRKL